MKMLKLKSIIIAPAIVIATGLFTGSVYGQATTALNKNLSGLKQEKAAISKDLATISLQREKVQALRQKYWDEYGAGLYNTNTQSEFIRARADLQRDKNYLKADKVALLNQYDAVINNRRTMILDERAQLRDLQRKLNKDLAKGNASAVIQAQDIVNCRHNIKQNEFALRHEIVNRNTELLAINKEIGKANGQSVVVLATENGIAKTQDLTMK